MRKKLAFLWIFIVLVGVIYLASRMLDGFTFRSDLMALLPREEQNATISQVNDSVTRALSKRIILLIGHPNPQEARAAAIEISQFLSNSGLLSVSFLKHDKEKLKHIGALYFPYRYGLLTREDRKHLEEGKAQKLVDRSLAQIFGSVGITNTSLLTSDPFLLMPSYITGLPVPTPRLKLEDGLLTLRDKEKTWILISGNLLGEPYDLDVQERFSDTLHKVEKASTKAHPGLTVLRTGVLFFAKAGADEAMNETMIIGMLSLIGIIILLVTAFRSFFPLMMGLLVISTGLMLALSFSLWFWGELHVCALLFGMSLMGVSVDYSLHYCSQIFVPNLGNPSERLKSVFSGITLGVFTTIIGYTALFLAPFPGLRQIALFSVVGLFASWASTVLWLPFLDKMKASRRDIPWPSLIKMCAKFWGEKSLYQYKLASGAFLIILCAWGIFHFHTDDDVRKLQTLSSSLVAEQEKIQQLIGSTNRSQFFLIQAKNDEEALQKEETLIKKLHPLIDSGALGSFQALSSYIPSLAQQSENRRLLIENLYKPYLAKQAQMLNISSPLQMPQENEPGLTLDNIKDLTETFDFISILRPEHKAGNVLHIVTLEGVCNPTQIAACSENIVDVRFIDPARDYSLLFKKYRERSVYLLMISILLMLSFLSIRYGFKKAVILIFPPVLAVALTPALLGTFGAPFTFFNAIALILILSIGIDYSIFFMETRVEKKLITTFAVLISALTTLMSFGFLVFSNVPAVHSFGLTMLIGVCLSLIFSPLAHEWSKIKIKTRKMREIVSLFLLFFLSGCETQDTKNQLSLNTSSSFMELSPNLSLHMPSLDLGREIDVVQNIVAFYDGQTISFQARIHATKEHFTVIFLDQIGRQIMSIKWTEKDIYYETAPWLPPQLQPQNILADFIFLYWPERHVKEAFRSCGSVACENNKRSLRCKGEEVLRAEYFPTEKENIWEGKIAYKNLTWNYTLNIQSAKLLP